MGERRGSANVHEPPFTGVERGRNRADPVAVADVDQVVARARDDAVHLGFTPILLGVGDQEVVVCEAVDVVAPAAPDDLVAPGGPLEQVGAFRAVLRRVVDVWRMYGGGMTMMLTAQLQFQSYWSR